MKRRLSSLFIVFMVLAPLAVAIDQQPAKPAPAAVKPDCSSKSNILNTACGRCGDGQCVKSCGETPTTCPADCGVESPKKS